MLNFLKLVNFIHFEAVRLKYARVQNGVRCKIWLYFQNHRRKNLTFRYFIQFFRSQFSLLEWKEFKLEAQTEVKSKIWLNFRSRWHEKPYSNTSFDFQI